MVFKYLLFCAHISTSLGRRNPHVELCQISASIAKFLPDTTATLNAAQKLTCSRISRNGMQKLMMWPRQSRLATQSRPCEFPRFSKKETKDTKYWGRKKVKFSFFNFENVHYFNSNFQLRCLITNLLVPLIFIYEFRV